MNKPFNNADFVKQARPIATELANLGKSTFDTTVALQRKLGLVFLAGLAAYQVGTPKATVGTYFESFKDDWTPLAGRTVLVSQCAVFAARTEAQLKADKARYLKVGLNDSKSVKNGVVILRAEYLAEGVRAEIRGDWAADGTVTKAANNATAKAKAGRQAKAAQKLITAKDKLSVSRKSPELAMAWDFRYFTKDQLALVAEALAAEESRRKAGGKMLPAPK